MFTSIREPRKRPARTSGRDGDEKSDGAPYPQIFTQKTPRSLVTRRIQNLTAILQLSLLRRDITRAQRAFGLLLRCGGHGASIRRLWEHGLEILVRSSGASKDRAEEFLGRVRLMSSDIGHHPTTEKQVRRPLGYLVTVLARFVVFRISCPDDTTG